MSKPTRSRLRVVHRVGLAVAAAFAAAVTVAIVVAIVDLYATGHGLPSLTREVISWAPGDVHLSFGDTVVLAVAALTASAAWRTSGR